jgi:hypothetical protein
VPLFLEPCSGYCKLVSYDPQERFPVTRTGSWMGREPVVCGCEDVYLSPLSRIDPRTDGIFQSPYCLLSLEAVNLSTTQYAAATRCHTKTIYVDVLSPENGGM